MEFCHLETLAPFQPLQLNELETRPSLRAGDKVDVVVLVLHLHHPLADGLGEVGIGLDPRCVEAQRERRPVALVVSL